MNNSKTPFFTSEQIAQAKQAASPQKAFEAYCHAHGIKIEDFPLMPPAEYNQVVDAWVSSVRAFGDELKVAHLAEMGSNGACWLTTTYG